MYTEQNYAVYKHYITSLAPPTKLRGILVITVNQSLCQLAGYLKKLLTDLNQIM